MGLNLQKKEQVVSKISKVLEIALSAVVASLEGMTVNELTGLRALCRKNDVYVYIVRNTLLYRALSGTIFKCLCPLFKGSNIIAFSTVEASDCARLFVGFSKGYHEKFKIKGAAFDGEFIEASKITLLSALPTYKDCIVRLIFIIQECAVGKLVRLLHAYSSRMDKK